MNLKNGFMVCKKCKEWFHPSWLEEHKLSHDGKGFFGNIFQLTDGVDGQ